jgi:hypothetical protein
MSDIDYFKIIKQNKLTVHWQDMRHLWSVRYGPFGLHIQHEDLEYAIRLMQVQMDEERERFNKRMMGEPAKREQ